jgi:hypothetical protein
MVVGVAQLPSQGRLAVDELGYLPQQQPFRVVGA